MVERFHRQLKAAIMAHESPNSWTTTLPAVLLGIRSAVKETLNYIEAFQDRSLHEQNLKAQSSIETKETVSAVSQRDE